MHSTSPRPLAVGLEMVQAKFQPLLDKFVAGRLSELDLYLATEWETRWVWPYELYLPVLRACRRYSIPLIALSIDSETLSKLRAEGGISNLSGFEMRKHVGDASVFAAMMRESGFKNYVNECITPSYAAHYKLGLLNEATNFNTYFTSRMFRDEAMATRAVRHVLSNDGTLVCLLGADHVKFEYGVTGRVRRQLVAERNKIRQREIMVRMADGRSTDDLLEVADPLLKTVMLNPGPADAYDAKDGSLKLEMPVGSIPVPIADYLWFSTGTEANPRRQIRRRVLPPVERLTSS
ncbi:heme-binding uptake Tiki ChaN [Gracilaria domingensis]|nr:heme-binding uptake Tiki ChaN [Gracilaria domingensis]